MMIDPPSCRAIISADLPHVPATMEPEDAAEFIRNQLRPKKQYFEALMCGIEGMSSMPLMAEDGDDEATTRTDGGSVAALRELVCAIEAIMETQQPSQLLQLYHWLHTGIHRPRDDLHSTQPNLQRRLIDAVEAYHLTQSDLPAIPAQGSDRERADACVAALSAQAKIHERQREAALDHEAFPAGRPHLEQLHRLQQQFDAEILDRLTKAEVDAAAVLHMYQFMRKNSFIGPRDDSDDSAAAAAAPLTQLQRWYLQVRSEYQALMKAYCSAVQAGSSASSQVRLPSAVKDGGDVLQLHSPQQLLAAIAEQRPCVVEFYTEWCAPCNTIAPKIAELAKGTAGVRFYKVNAEKVVTPQFKIRAMPTFIFFNNGEQVDEVVGALLADVIASVDKLVASAAAAQQSTS